MTLRRTLSRALVPAALATLALPTAACAETPAAETTQVPTAKVAAPLWKIADADTTIYLFGTVHFLTDQTVWFDDRIGAALNASETLVTELPYKVLEDPASQQQVMVLGLLPEGQSLRAMLTAEQRASYEAVLTRLEIPAESFDRFEPWLAGMTLAVLPLLKNGFKPDRGVEKILETRAPEGAGREALETLDGQMKLFDGLPHDEQIKFLMATVEGNDKIVPGLSAMVEAWAAGDPDRLAAIMNSNMTDPALAEHLLYARNRAWAAWIDTRLDKPGTVFVAVGAGHLAGPNSVQAYLTGREIRAIRVH